MQLNGDILIAAPPDAVWRALNDPQALLHSIPGAEEVRQVSPTETHLRVAIKLGPVRARFVGKIIMSDVRPGEGCVLNFEGVGGAAGSAKGSSTVTLASEAGGTRLNYTAEASVGGKLGQIGGRMIDASAKQTADQFFAAFAKQLVEPSTVEPTSASSTSSSRSASTSPSPHEPVAAFAPSLAVPSRAPTNAGSGVTGEGVRVLWFGLGVLATSLGFFLASVLSY